MGETLFLAMLSFKTFKEMEMSECLNIKIYKKAKQKHMKEAVKTSVNLCKKSQSLTFMGRSAGGGV